MEYRSSIVGLTILVSQSSKDNKVKREAHPRGLKFDF